MFKKDDWVDWDVGMDLGLVGGRNRGGSRWNGEVVVGWLGRRNVWGLRIREVGGWIGKIGG